MTVGLAERVVDNRSGLIRQILLVAGPSATGKNAAQWRELLASLAETGRLKKEVVLVPIGDIYTDSDRRWVVESVTDRSASEPATTDATSQNRANWTARETGEID